MPRRRNFRRIFFLAFIFSSITYLYYSNSSSSPDPSTFNPANPQAVPNTPRQPYDRTWYERAKGAVAPGSITPRTPLPELTFDEDGILRGWEELQKVGSGDGAGGYGKEQKRILRGLKKTHPIEVLIQKGVDKYNAMLARQSKTLAQASKEYTHRYRRSPPKGFDKWWEFCKKNRVHIVDDYDQIDKDVAPYFALSPALFRKRVEELRTTGFTSQINLSPTSPSSITGERSTSSRQVDLFNLVHPLAPLLPQPIEFHVSDHDMGSWLLGDDQRVAALEAVGEGRYLTDGELKGLEKREGRRPVKGLLSVCPEDSLGWRGAVEGENVPSLRRKTATFVHDPRPGYDFCNDPSLLLYHGSLSFDFVRETILRPIFQLSKFSRNPEFLTPPLQAYENHTSTSAQQKTISWEGKTDDRLFWRGSSTGDSYTKNKKGGDWRRSHRPRLHLFAQAQEGDEKVWIDRGEGGWNEEVWSKGRLNEKYLDVGLIGKPHQCNEKDGTCAEMVNEIVFKDRVSPEVAATYKYVLDVDGNGWSSRFHRLIMSGSVVFKDTIYPEWNSDWLTPWVHYVPVQHDYSDLYNIMSFFAGSPDGRRAGRSDLARDIAKRANEFGRHYWRWEDMQAYMFRLLLEYNRLLADDREAESYNPGGI